MKEEISHIQSPPINFSNGKSNTRMIDDLPREAPRFGIPIHWSTEVANRLQFIQAREMREHSRRVLVKVREHVVDVTFSVANVA